MSRGVRVCSLAELDAAGGLLAVEGLGREALVVRAGTGEVFAVDRYCAHEAYPLDDGGEVRGETITCPHHGWCFDLRSGACLTAGEDTRAYAVALQGGDVLVELDVAASDAERARESELLLSAIEAGDGGRAARHAVRLLDVGGTGAQIATLLVRYAATHGPGLSWAGVAAADALALAAVDPRSEPLLLAEAAAVLAECDGHAPPRLEAEPASPFAYDGPQGAAAALTDSCERGRAEDSEAIVAGLLERGAEPDDVARMLGAAAAARFRGPLVLPLVERAGRLAALDRSLARRVLPAAAKAVALSPPLDHAAPYRDRSSPQRPPARLAAELGEALRRFDLAHERDDAHEASLLLVGESLVHLQAAAWLGDERALQQAAWLADDARAWQGSDDPAPVELDDVGLVRLAAEAAASASGEATCLAAASAALALGDPQARAGVIRLLRTPRRERFTARAVAAERRRRHG